MKKKREAASYFENVMANFVVLCVVAAFLYWVYMGFNLFYIAIVAEFSTPNWWQSEQFRAASRLYGVAAMLFVIAMVISSAKRR